MIAANDDLTIVGNGDTIERRAISPEVYRLLTVAPQASLTLQSLTLEGGDDGGGPVWEGPLITRAL